MALTDYLNVSGNTRDIFSLGKSSTAPSGDPLRDSLVQDADSKLAKATRLRELRNKAASIQQKIDNLVNQRKAALERYTQLKKQREALTDDEIVRMAKVKGIRDEDINSYINGRITQRNADIANAGNVNAQNEINAQEEANKLKEEAEKAAKVKEVTDRLDEVVREISTLNVDIGEGNAAAKAKAEASKRLAEKRYETLKKQYKDLTDTEWTDEPEEYSRTSSVVPEDTEVPKDTFAQKPEGWSFTDYGAWLDADEKGKAAIGAKYKDKAVAKANAKTETERKRDEIKAQAKNKNLSQAAKDALVTKYRNTFPEGKKPSRSDIRKTLFGE